VFSHKRIIHLLQSPVIERNGRLNFILSFWQEKTLHNIVLIRNNTVNSRLLFIDIFMLVLLLNLAYFYYMTNDNYNNIIMNNNIAKVCPSACLQKNNYINKIKVSRFYMFCKTRKIIISRV